MEPIEQNNFEKFPGAVKTGMETASEGNIAAENDFSKAMSEGVPEFRGFGARNEAGVPEIQELKTEDATRSMPEVEPKVETEPGEEFDQGITDAAALINYGLDAAARELGIETVVQKIKGFDASGRENPIRDLFEYLGVDTPEEVKAVEGEGDAAAVKEQTFREGVNAPSQRRTVEGAFKALDDMKELISEVEGADPRYEDLRAGAQAAGKGYFEFAVMNFGTRGLTELFQVLAEQREMAEEKEEEEGPGTKEEANKENVADENMGENIKSEKTCYT